MSVWIEVGGLLNVQTQRYVRSKWPWIPILVHFWYSTFKNIKKFYNGPIGNVLVASCSKPCNGPPSDRNPVIDPPSGMHIRIFDWGLQNEKYWRGRPQTDLILKWDEKNFVASTAPWKSPSYHDSGFLVSILITIFFAEPSAPQIFSCKIRFFTFHCNSINRFHLKWQKRNNYWNSNAVKLIYSHCHFATENRRLKYTLEC